MTLSLLPPPVSYYFLYMPLNFCSVRSFREQDQQDIKAFSVRCSPSPNDDYPLPFFPPPLFFFPFYLSLYPNINF